MHASWKTALALRWVRGAALAGAIWVTPVVLTRLAGGLGADRERIAIAQEAERQQRAGGEVFVTSSGERARAIVYANAPPSPGAANARMENASTWWIRAFLAILLLELLVDTWHTLRQHNRRVQADPARLGATPPLDARAVEAPDSSWRSREPAQPDVARPGMHSRDTADGLAARRSTRPGNGNP